MWSECSCVMRIAESEWGSSPRNFRRLRVSRQEIPASTIIWVCELATTAQFPRLPEASMETLTPMPASILVHPVNSVVTFWLADTFARFKARYRHNLPNRSRHVIVLRSRKPGATFGPQISCSVDFHGGQRHANADTLHWIPVRFSDLGYAPRRDYHCRQRSEDHTSE